MKWLSRKLVLTVIALAGVAAGMVYAFMKADGAVMLACIAAIGLITGAYNVANAWQNRAYSGACSIKDIEPDKLMKGDSEP